VDNELYIISIKKTTHQDSVKKSGLQRILFLISLAYGAISIVEKYGLQRIFFHGNFLLDHCGMHLI